MRASVDQLPAAIGSIRLRSAATAGDAAAAYEIGVRYAEGRGVPADMDEAARWFERAAAKGLAPAQFRYGSLLEKGQGVKKDLAQARRLYLAAAAKPATPRPCTISPCSMPKASTASPITPPPRNGSARRPITAFTDSQFNLGVLYARGLGVEPNLTESYKWFALAADKGDKEAAKKRDEVAAGSTRTRSPPPSMRSRTSRRAAAGSRHQVPRRPAAGTMPPPPPPRRKPSRVWPHPWCLENAKRARSFLR